MQDNLLFMVKLHLSQSNQHEYSPNTTTRTMTPPRDSHSRQYGRRQPKDWLNTVQNHVRLCTSPAPKSCGPITEDFVGHYGH